MKKRIAIAVMAALIVSFSGCGNTDQPQTIQDSSSIETVTRKSTRFPDSAPTKNCGTGTGRRNYAGFIRFKGLCF